MLLPKARTVLPGGSAASRVDSWQPVSRRTVSYTHLKGDIALLEKALRVDQERIERKLIEHDGKFALLQWMVGIVIALAVANFAKQYF